MINIYNSRGRLTRKVTDAVTVVAEHDAFKGGSADAIYTAEYKTIYVKYDDIFDADEKAFIYYMIDDVKYVPFPDWGMKYTIKGDV